MHKLSKHKLSHLAIVVAVSLTSLLSGCGVSTVGSDETPEEASDPVLQNSPPTATNGEVILAAGETNKVIDLSGFVTDPDGDVVKVTAVSTSNGQVQVTTGTKILYSTTLVPKSGDKIIYVVTDGEFEVSGKISLMGSGSPSQPTPTNTAPLAVDDEATIKAGTPAVLDVLANDVDVDGDALSIKSVTSTSGTVAVSGGKVTFTPKIDFSGVANIEYALSDGVANVRGHVVVTVLPYTMSAMLSWVAPDERVDGEPLDPTTEIDSYNVLYKEARWSEFKTVAVVGSKSQVLLQNLGIGNYTIRIAAMDHVGLASEYSEITAYLTP
jgi:hypothetical protein